MLPGQPPSPWEQSPRSRIVSIGSTPPCPRATPSPQEQSSLTFTPVACSSPPFFGSPGSRKILAFTPRLPKDHRCLPTRFTPWHQLCVLQATRHSGAIIISSGASTTWQKDRRGIDRRHPGPMRRGSNSPAWSMGAHGLWLLSSMSSAVRVQFLKAACDDNCMLDY